MQKYKTIGIIGGQGPVSTADFYLRIVKYYQVNFGARYVRDFPPMIIFSVPTPDLVESVEDEETTFSLIAEATKKLERDGSDFIIIACNSLQYFIERLQTTVKIPIIGIAPLIAEYIKDKGYKTVGLLATNTTIKKKIYEFYLGEKGIQLITPGEIDQNSVTEVILNEIGGISGVKEMKKLKKVVDSVRKAGAEAILLACTELPLVIKQQDVSITLIDCNELYIQKAAKFSSNT